MAGEAKYVYGSQLTLEDSGGSAAAAAVVAALPAGTTITDLKFKGRAWEGSWVTGRVWLDKDEKKQRGLFQALYKGGTTIADVVVENGCAYQLTTTWYLLHATVVALTATPRPSVNHTQNVAEGTPQQIDGVWAQVWAVTDATPEQIAERTAAQASDMRQERNARLAACDWTQLADAPVNSLGWANYRQALRDITAQDGFPWIITWPEQP
jgi:hypothetical protein